MQESMSKIKILYQAKQEIFGKHVKARQWVEYEGILTVYNRKPNPVMLKIESQIEDSFLAEVMDENKEFKGNSITEVYAKLSKWLYQRGVIFQN